MAIFGYIIFTLFMVIVTAYIAIANMVTNAFSGKSIIDFKNPLEVIAFIIGFSLFCGGWYIVFTSFPFTVAVK